MCLIKKRFLLRTLVVFFVFVAHNALADHVTALGKEFDRLKFITGYRATPDTTGKLEIRLLEEDGSSSVALNPCYLYLVITNNGSVDHQSRVWALPINVVKVVGIKAVKSGVVITAKRETGEGKRALLDATITVSYDFSGTVLGDIIDVGRR
jgi:hypothetical protein